MPNPNLNLKQKSKILFSLFFLRYRPLFNFVTVVTSGNSILGVTIKVIHSPQALLALKLFRRGNGDSKRARDCKK